jgi:predicted nucleic acid-binding protein
MPDSARKLLDSFAMLAYLNAEAAHDQVADLLQEAARKRVRALMSAVNLGEVYYIEYKERAPAKAEEALSRIAMLPVEIVVNTFDDVMAAARLKARYPIAYANAFAAATAMRVGAALVTGDPEFETLESEVEIVWLPRT